MNVFSEAMHRLKINVWTLYIGAFVGLALLFALPTPSFAQSGENAASGTTSCVDWNDGPGRLTNSTNFTVELDMCGGSNGHLFPGETSNDNLKDIEAVWGLCDTSEDGLCAYRTLGNKNIPITKRYIISSYSYGPPSYGILPDVNEERDPDWLPPAIRPTYRVVQYASFLPKFVLYFGKQHVSPMWDTSANTELNLNPAQKSSLNSIWLQDYRSMLLTNAASGRQRCIWYSVSDISMVQFPGGNSSMGLKNNIDRIQTFGDNTCGGLDRNQDGSVDSTVCPAVSAKSAIESVNTVVNDTCGTNPNPAPGTTPVPPPPSVPQNPGQHVVVYLQTDYRNAFYELEPGGWDVQNREYNSISVPSGWSIVLVESGGHASCFNQSLHNLQDHESWRFNIDAIEVYDSNICGSNGGEPPLTPLGDWFARFWSDTDFYGWGVKYKFWGDENYFWVNNVRDGLNPTMNDDFESLEINSNRAVILYEHDNLQGGAKCFTANDSNLWDDRFDNGQTVANQASSIRFFTRSECNFRPNAPVDIWVHEAKRGSITITWVKSSPDTDSYHLKLFQNGSFSTLTTISEDQARQNAAALGLDTNWIRAWTYTAVTCGNNYTFAVSAQNDRAESYNSRQVTGKFDCDCNDPTYSGVGLYDLRYCQGDNVIMTNPGLYYLDAFNERSSAIFVKPGWSVEVFENTDNVNGLTNCFNESKWDLSYDNYWLKPVAVEGTLSTVRVWSVPNCGRSLPMAGCDAVNSANVVLFDYTHCLGRDFTLANTGFYELNEFEDLTSPIFVPPGKSARLYVNKNKGGNYVCVKETKWDMKYDPYWLDNTQDTFNNVSAVEVFNDSLCGGIVKPMILFPTATDVISDVVPVNFTWVNSYAGGYWAELWGPGGYFKSSGHLISNEWFVGELQAGQHTFRVLSEVFGTPSEWVEVTFNVIDTTPDPVMTVNYTLDPTQVNRVTFIVANCVGAWVHVEFGHDGVVTDSPCANGQSSIQHDYPYWGESATFYATVGGISITVNLPRLKDCGELKPTTGISLFGEKDCRGERRDFATPGNYALSDYNDQATAIMVANGWSVEVFENYNSSDGHAYCVTRDIWDLSYESYYATQGMKLDNTVSNIRVYNDSTCGKELPQYGGCDANISFEGIVLFDYIHCGGSEAKFNQPGKYELGFDEAFNNLASSAHIGAGWSVQVFSESGWQGDQVCLHTTDKWDFGVDKYWQSEKFVTNSISSIEVFHNSACTPDTPAPVPPAAPTNLLPSGGIFTFGQAVMLKWDVVLGTTYVVEVAGAQSESINVNQNQLNYTPKTVGNFSWKVKAVKDGLESAWSLSANFTVKSEEPPTPTFTPTPTLTPTPTNTPTPTPTLKPGETPPTPTCQAPLLSDTECKYSVWNLEGGILRAE